MTTLQTKAVRLAASALAVGALALALAAPAAAQYSGIYEFGKNKVRYEDFDWQIYHSPHFDVYYYVEEEHLLQRVVSFAESAYDQLSQEFDFKIQQPTPLIIYETHAAFEQNNIILNFIPEGTGAFATPVRNRMVLPVDLPGPELMQLILHELTHIFEYHMLFGGNLGKGVASTPPLWFMEGLASYMAKDETARDKMFLRDAVVNDNLPPVTANFGGFFAYRFGHAIFEFIEERWGKEGIRDFMIEIRNTLGGRVGRALERTFGIDPEDFNSEFRRWLRQRYLPELIETGEPGDFGRPYRLQPGRGSAGAQISPAASPSGDLLAAFTTHKGEVDVMLFDNRNRRVMENLTKGYETNYQYLVAQELTLGRKMGRDLAFSPDGNTLALFARKDRGRRLVLIDVLKAKVVRDYTMGKIDQQVGPAFSPDGKKVAFAGHLGGNFDIFELDLETGDVAHVTDDEIYDGSPVYSPDGKSIVLSSVVGGHAKLFRIDRDNPSERYPLTYGESDETDAVFSADGERIYFTSDRTGANNIYSLDLESKVYRQHTNAVTGCFMPTVLASPDGGDRVVFTGFWKGNFDLFLVDVDEPITEATVVDEKVAEVTEALSATELPRFEPSIEVTIDDSNRDKYGGFNFFIENVGGTLGVSDDQTFVGVAVIQLSDFLGDRRIIAQFQSISSFQNFDVIYADLSRRWNWQVHLFDNRDYYVAQNQRTGFVQRVETALEQTGVLGSIIYPINISHRGEAGVGYMRRKLNFFGGASVPVEDISTNDLLGLLPPDIVQQFLSALPPDITEEELRAALIAGFYRTGFADVVTFEPRTDTFPVVFASIHGDSATFAPWGAVTGRRWYLKGSWAPDTTDSGTLTSNVTFEARQYIPLSRRSNFALRLYASAADGNATTPIYFGGFGTVRGYDFRSLVGDRAFFSTAELRFPLIDILATPVLNFQGIRGNIFLDVAGAWFDEVSSFRLWDGDANRLGCPEGEVGCVGAVASYGMGVTFRLFGFDVNLDFSKRWDFENTLSRGYRSELWFGARF